MAREASRSPVPSLVPPDPIFSKESDEHYLYAEKEFDTWIKAGYVVCQKLVRAEPRVGSVFFPHQFACWNRYYFEQHIDGKFSQSVKSVLLEFNTDLFMPVFLFEDCLKISRSLNSPAVRIKDTAQNKKMPKRFSHLSRLIDFKHLRKLPSKDVMGFKGQFSELAPYIHDAISLICARIINTEKSTRLLFDEIECHVQDRYNFLLKLRFAWKGAGAIVCFSDGKRSSREVLINIQCLPERIKNRRPVTSFSENLAHRLNQFYQSFFGGGTRSRQTGFAGILVQQ